MLVTVAGAKFETLREEVDKVDANNVKKLPKVEHIDPAETVEADTLLKLPTPPVSDET